MRRAPSPFFLVGVAFLVACTGDPVGEAPSDGDVDSGGGTFDTRSDTRTDTGGDTAVPKTDAETSVTDTGVDASGPTIAGKECTKKSDCDPGGTTGAECLLQAPTPMCYGAKCSPKTVEPTISDCPDEGVCLDDGAGGGICVPLCYFDAVTGTLVQGCLGKNLCWYVGTATISGSGYVYGRCEGRCGSDADCPTGTKCQEDGRCLVAPKTFAGAIGDACADTDDGTKCACVYSPATKLGYCSKFCRVGDAADCPTGFTCDADVPASITSVPLDGILGNCLKDCTGDGECTNAYCEQHGAVSHKTCQPGAR